MKPTQRMIDFGKAAFSVNYKNTLDLLVERVFEVMYKQMPPIPMILFCPCCGVQHIDQDETNGKMHAPICNISCGIWGGCSCGFSTLWTNPPHRSHLCADCGFIWRPADVCTEGVAVIQTKGENDVDITEFRSRIKRITSEGKTAGILCRLSSWEEKT